MRKLVVLAALMVSGSLWADWFCDSLEFGNSEVTVKDQYVKIIKDYCDKVVIDYTGRCHLIEFYSDGSASIKNESEDDVRDLCIENKGCPARNSTTNQEDDEDDEPSWFVKFLISVGNSSPHWRR